MSFLAPLFVAGVLALSGPIVLHLIRRTPRGRVRFSSLMFLRESPPRITRRSRLDDVLLLAVRAAALGLLAFAFARPFLREAASAATTAGGRRVALLVDASASMRRGDLWARAVAKAEAAIDGASAVDRIALFTFDDRVREIAGWDEPEGATQGGQAKRALSTVRPGWAGTDLGAALVSTADALDALSRAESAGPQPAPSGPLEIILVSDLQEGSRLEALDSYDWPENVRLTVERVSTASSGNASIALLAGEGPAGSGPLARVRVSNDAGEARQLSLRWATATAPAGDEVSFLVQPGESRIVSLPGPPVGSGADRVVLGGDADGIDNTLYLVPPAELDVSVVYIGAAASNDPGGPRYYLERALASGSRRKPRFLDQATDQPLVFDPRSPPPLVVVTAGVADSLAASLISCVRSGGTVLVVLTDATVARSLPRLLECEGAEAREAETSDYAMLSEIDFRHPIFAPFADRAFGDFTNVRFWRHWRIKLDGSQDCGIRVIARFDDGAPALLEKESGQGRLLVLASGWQPRDSQLALSTKFVPLLASIIEREPDAGHGDRYSINDPLPLPPPDGGDGGRSVRKPDGTEIALARDAEAFDGTDEPGIYAVRSGGPERSFAVNVTPREQRTAPLAVEDLEARGVRLGSAAADAVRSRQLRDVELERAQSLWKWLLVAVLGLLILETWLGGRTRRQVVAGKATT